jgi:hypothetical protein
MVVNRLRNLFALVVEDDPLFADVRFGKLLLVEESKEGVIFWGVGFFFCLSDRQGQTHGREERGGGGGSGP